MEKQAKYIRRIEIKGLWKRFNIAWDLRPDVNILSGINGVGKTTILNRSVGYLEDLSGEMKNGMKDGVDIYFDDPEATYIPYDVIRSYDRPLIMGDFTARMADKNVKSELDWQLYLLQRRYLDYQVNIGNKMIELLAGNEGRRMSGQYYLYIGVQLTNHSDKFLLPLDVERGFRFIHEKNVMFIVLHQYSQQDNKHLFLTGREFIGQ